MITEDYVSFKIAKLLKEKGFDRYPLFPCYKEDNGEFIDIPTTLDTINYCFIPAPTIQEAMKWLREVQGLNVYVRAVWKDAKEYDWEPVVVGYDWFVESLLDNAYSEMSIEPFLTYEEACEEAIMYCLENLI